MQNENSNNPMDHTSNLKKEMSALIEHLRSDVSKVDDASAKALFEVSAEVLSGLKKSFEDFEQKNEGAWKK
ncbi:MAG: hypothetical protein ACTHK8_01585 [Ginsengibacter sp.]